MQVYRVRMDPVAGQIWIGFVKEHKDWYDSISLQVEYQNSKLAKKSAELCTGVKQNPKGKQEVV